MIQLPGKIIIILIKLGLTKLEYPVRERDQKLGKSDWLFRKNSHALKLPSSVLKKVIANKIKSRIKEFDHSEYSDEKVIV